MKIAVIFIACQRVPDVVFRTNSLTSGIRFDAILVTNGYQQLVPIPFVHAVNHAENLGIAKGVNPALRWAYQAGYDYVCTMADDIIEPQGWLKTRLKVMQRYRSGIVAISPEAKHLHAHYAEVIGNTLISRQCFEKIGYWNEEFGMYGPVDLDYNARARGAGLAVMYAPGGSVHLNTPVDYGYQKHLLVNQAWGRHAADVRDYNNGMNLYKP